MSENRVDIAHIEPGSLAGRYFRRFWHPVLRGEELAAGQAKAVRLMGEDFTLFRGQSGTPHMVGFRCAHRGTQLSTGWVEEDCIRCLYHGWKFAGNGQCVEQPAEEAGFAAKVKIPGYPVHEALGLIFAYIGEDEAPKFPYPNFQGEGIIETWANPFPCNYLSNVENSTDYYHLNWAHRTSAGASFHVATGSKVMTGYQPMHIEETDYGLMQRKRVGEIDFWSLLILPDALMSNPGIPARSKLLQDGVGGGLRPTYLFKVPIDDTNHVLYWTQLVKVKGPEADAYREKYARYRKLEDDAGDPMEVAREILAGKRSLVSAKEHPQFLILEDLVSQVGQGPIVDREHEWLGRSDSNLIVLRRVFERELRAMEEGQPLRQWKTFDQWPNL